MVERHQRRVRSNVAPERGHRRVHELAALGVAQRLVAARPGLHAQALSGEGLERTGALRVDRARAARRGGALVRRRAVVEDRLERRAIAIDAPGAVLRLGRATRARATLVDQGRRRARVVLDRRRRAHHDERRVAREARRHALRVRELALGTRPRHARARAATRAAEADWVAARGGQRCAERPATHSASKRQRRRIGRVP